MSREESDDALDGESSGKQPSRPGLPVDLHRVWRAVKRGKWWLLIAALVGSAVGLLVGKFAVRHTYEATASIRYEGLPGQQPMQIQNDLPPLVSVTHSEPVMGRLRERLGVDANINAMRARVGVMSDQGSGLVSFTGNGESPEEAARVANATVEVFLEHHRDRRRNDLITELRSIDGRIAAAEQETRRARDAYDAFRDQQGITDLTAEQEQAITQAAELRSEADMAQAEVQALEARVQQLRSTVASTPRMEAVSTGDSADARRLRELRDRLREASASLSNEHPQVQALQRQIASLERSVQGGGGSTVRMGQSELFENARTALATAETELESARRRRESLEQLAAQAQERTNRFSTIEGQAANLLAQVNVKQALVTQLTERKAQIDDELRGVEVGFRSVAEARPPESAVPSKKKYIVAAAIPFAFLSIMLGMLLFRELRGLKVQTPAEVAWWGNGPVIGTTTWPRDPRALIDLIADMDDFAPEAKGTMLVVGSTETDRELASEIAGQLNHDWSSTTLIDVPVVGALPAANQGGPRAKSQPIQTPPPANFDDDGYLDDDPIAGEIHDGPTELVLAPSGDLEGMGIPTGISSYAPPPPTDLDDPAERLICTAWNGPSEGQALRRAARLADRVLVVVTSNVLPATELAQIKQKLGRGEAVGFVLVGVSDDIARLPDRAGQVDSFWQGAARA